MVAPETETESFTAHYIHRLHLQCKTPHHCNYSFTSCIKEQTILFKSCEENSVVLGLVFTTVGLRISQLQKSQLSYVCGNRPSEKNGNVIILSNPRIHDPMLCKYFSGSSSYFIYLYFITQNVMLTEVCLRSIR